MGIPSRLRASAARPRGRGYVEARGDQWWMNARVQGQRVRRPLGLLVSETTQAEAEVALDRYLARPVATQPASGAPKLGAVLEGYIRGMGARGCRASSVANAESSRRALVRVLGAQTPIDRLDLNGYVLRRRDKDGVSTHSTNRDLRILKAAGRAAKCPVEITFGKVDKPAPQALTREEQDRLIAHAGEMRTAVLLLALSGLRAGEATKLTFKMVVDGEMRLPAEVCKGRYSRTVPVHPQLAEELARVRAERGAGPDDLVLPGYARSSELGRRLRAVWAAAKIKTKRPAHALRATAATRMLQAGIDVKTVQEIFGWQSLSVVAHYASTDAAAKRRAIESL